MISRNVALITLSVMILEMITCTRLLAQSISQIDASNADPLSIEYSSVPLARNANLLVFVAKGVNLGTDAGLSWLSGGITEQATWKGRLTRLAKLYFLDAPIASLAHVCNHEYGHGSALSQEGYPFTVRITKLPWPVPLTYGETIGGSEPLALRVVGGGPEASQVLATSVFEEVAARRAASYFDALLYVYTKLDVSAYALTDMSRRRLRNPRDFFESELGDPRLYALTLATASSGGKPTFGQIQEVGNRIRRGAWLNLVDYMLVTQLASIGRGYLLEGTRTLRNHSLKVGPVNVVPRVSYNLGALGPEYLISSWVGTGGVEGTVSIRWGETASGLRTKGAGISFARWPSATLPSTRLDVWSQPGRRLGGRLELGKRFEMSWFGRRYALAASAGAKTGGYLLGLPQRPGLYGSAGVTARFGRLSSQAR